MRTRTISDSDPRLYMRAPSLCLAETITSLIETKTIADRHFARGRSSRDETSAARRGANGRGLLSFYCSQIECRFSAASRRKSKEVEIEELFSALDLPECIRCCGVAVETFLTRAYDHETPHAGGFDIPFYLTHAVAPFPLYDTAATKGYLEVCYIFAWGYANTRICSRTRAPTAIPLIL